MSHQRTTLPYVYLTYISRGVSNDVVTPTVRRPTPILTMDRPTRRYT